MLQRLVAVVVLVGCHRAAPPEVAVTPDPLDAPIPVDPLVRSGRFENGLTWYVQVNAKPDDRAVLRLAVDAGSVLEDPDQLGLAHFVEHMAFNGTKNFPHNDLVKYLESIGTQFGPHLNAHTSFDETVYKLQVPTTDAEIFETSFLVLEDWASGVTFDPAEVEKERGVVLEEWRLRRGVQGRLTDAVVPLQFHGSPYAERLPIGTEESLKTFDPAALVRFYETWYRPEHMAVVAVGDFDPDEVAAKIQAHFEHLPKTPEGARERARPTIPDHDETFRLVFADAEMPRSQVSLGATVDAPQAATLRQWREQMLQAVGLQVLDERLAALAKQPSPPFLQAGAGEQRLTPLRAIDQVGAGVTDGGVLVAYESLLTEVARLQLHGVQPGELDRAKRSVLKGYETMLAQKDQLESASEADEIYRHHLQREPMPGTVGEVALAKEYVPSFTADEVSSWAKGWLPEKSRLVLVTSPKKDGLPIPTEAELAAVEQRVAAATIAPPAPEVALPPLLPAPPTPGTVTGRDDAALAPLGFTKLALSNGVSVFLKKTDFKDDEILFSAWSPGGESKVADADVVSARLATQTMWASGIGQLDATMLDRWYAGRTLSVRHRMSETSEGLTGSATVVDLPAALELLHASLVAPRFTPDGWAVVRAQQEAQLVNREADPQTRFQDAYTTLVWADPRKQPWTVATLDRAKLDAMQAVWTDRFGDLSDATFVLVGDLPDDVEAQVATWLGSLPGRSRAEAWVDRKERPKTGALQAEVRAGVEPKARVRIEWRGDLASYDWDTRFALSNLQDVMSVLLREKLREELGGVYGVGVASVDVHAPYRGYQVTVDFSCDPARVEELVTATYAVVDELRKNGPEARIVDQEKEKRARKREEDLKTNGFWLNVFSMASERGLDPLGMLQWDARNTAVTPLATRDAARRWLVDANRTKVVLLPTTSEPARPPG
jgi:zinc protease